MATTRGEWLEKSKLPFGIYEAKADWDGKHYTFRPVRVTAESPETIVFVPMKIEPFEIRYRGRVIHGTNGDPIAGQPSCRRRCRTVRRSRSRRFPASGTAGGPADACEPTRRADIEITLPIVTQPGPEHALIAIKEGYFAFQQQRSSPRVGVRGQEGRAVRNSPSTRTAGRSCPT